MKKILSFALIICLSIILIGCGNSNAAALSNNIETNVNRLNKIISKISEANINDLQIPEFSTISNVDLKSVNDTFTLKDSKTGKEYVKTRSSTTSNKNNLKNVKSNSGRKTSSQLALNNLSNKKYKARHANINDVNFTNQSYNNYLNKVENLYVMVKDVTCANEKNITLKTDILNSCKILKDISKQLKKRGSKVSDSQVKSCNDLLETLKLYTNKISLGRNEITTECKNVNNIKSNLTASIDQVTTKYLKLLNAMDTRLTFYENTLSTLKQIINCLDSDKLENLEKYSNYKCKDEKCENEDFKDSTLNLENENNKSQKISKNNTVVDKQNIDTYRTPTINPNIINRRNNYNNNYYDNYNRNSYNINYPNQYPYNNNYNYGNPYNGIPTIPNINTDTYKHQTAGVNNISNQIRINNSIEENNKIATNGVNNNNNTPIYGVSKDINKSVVLFNPTHNTKTNIGSNSLVNNKKFDMPKKINGTNIEQKNLTSDEEYRTLELEKKDFKNDSSNKIRYSKIS